MLLESERVHQRIIKGAGLNLRAHFMCIYTILGPLTTDILPPPMSYTVSHTVALILCAVCLAQLHVCHYGIHTCHRSELWLR